MKIARFGAVSAIAPPFAAAPPGRLSFQVCAANATVARRAEADPGARLSAAAFRSGPGDLSRPAASGCGTAPLES
jgi:hypothetical protein